MRAMLTTLSTGLLFFADTSSVLAQPSAQEIFQSERWSSYLQTRDLRSLWPKEVVDESSCLRRGGVWQAPSPQGWSGCLVRGQQVGVWTRWTQDLEPSSHLSVTETPLGRLGLTLRDGTPESLGYYVNNMREGESVFFNTDGSFNGFIPFSKGKAHGSVTRYHPNGSRAAEVTYVQGKRDGKVQTWGMDCTKLEDVHYKEDLREGQAYFWNSRGVLTSEGAFKADKRVGPWRFYSSDQGILLEEGTYDEQGRRTGVWKEYFSSGTFFREVTYEADKRQGELFEACSTAGGEWAVDLTERTEGCFHEQQPHGLQLLYYPDAKLRRRTTLVKGLLDGSEEWLYPSGKLLFEGSWRAGQPTGVHKAYSEAGALVASYDMSSASSGKPIEVTRFLPNGQPHERGSYVNGLRHGIWMLWDDKGGPESEETWQEGQRLGPFKQWREGVLTLEGVWEGEDRRGHWTAYFLNGRAAWTGEYDGDGLRTGEWRQYYPSGVLRAQGAMLNNWEMGFWRFFYDNAELESEGFYNNGSRVGPWRFFFKSGELWREAIFRDGFEIDTPHQQCEEGGGTWRLIPEARLGGCVTCRWKEGLKDQEDEAPSAAMGRLGDIPEEASTTTAASPTEPRPEATGALSLRGWVEEASVHKWVFWYPSGAREKEGNYVNNQEEGEWSFWDTNGKLSLKGSFKAGQEEGVWEGFYDNGNKRYRGSFVEGAPQGAWLRYHANGQAALEVTYEQGKPQGTWRRFADNGQLIEDGTYDKGQAVGMWRTYYPNGAQKSEGSYDAGKRTGNWRWYRQDGSLWREALYVEGREQR